MIRPIPRPAAYDPLTRPDRDRLPSPEPAPKPVRQAWWWPITVRRPGAPAEQMRALARTRRDALARGLEAYPDALITG